MCFRFFSMPAYMQEAIPYMQEAIRTDSPELMRTAWWEETVNGSGARDPGPATTPGGKALLLLSLCPWKP